MVAAIFRREAGVFDNRARASVLAVLCKAGLASVSVAMAALSPTLDNCQQQ